MDPFSATPGCNQLLFHNIIFGNSFALNLSRRRELLLSAEDRLERLLFCWQAAPSRMDTMIIGLREGA